ncbi:MAG: hypothetical protein U5L72_02960 [Bacteroidales bacterium]|nr:hypothetical protein [Bacteroidales bacterium]
MDRNLPDGTPLGLDWALAASAAITSDVFQYHYSGGNENGFRNP